MVIDRIVGSTPEAIDAVPVAIGNVLGWFSPGRTSRGVLMCGTYGFEQLCAYRPWRELAQRLSAAGCATLRIEYPGHGDSGDAIADGLQPSLDAIRDGVGFLRERAGADEIVLVGLRLGGTLAALAASDGGVDRLALMAPFAGGKAYLREMSMQAQLIDRMPDRTPLPRDPGRLTVGGFDIAAETMAELARVDLTAATRPPASRILLLTDKAGLLAAQYRRLGSAVTEQPLPGLPQLVGDPLFPRIPEAAFAAIVAFASEGAVPRPAVTPSVAPARIDGKTWIEEVRHFGPGLVGILCRPRTPQNKPGVLLLSSGRNVRSGYGRQSAALARRLAENGILSFRIDPLGIGDSAERPDGSLPFFATDAVAEVRAALDHLQGEPGTGSIVVVGSCSGAFLAFHAACADDRVRGVMAINPFCFEVRPGTDVEAMVRDSFRNGVSYAARARQGEFWRRVLRREIRPSAILRAIWRDGLAQLRRRTARIAWLSPDGQTVAGRVAALRRRDCRLRLIYSVGDQGLAAAHAHFGSSPNRAARALGYPISVLEGVDHNLSPPAAQARVFALLMETLRDVERQDVRTAWSETARSPRFRERLLGVLSPRRCGAATPARHRRDVPSERARAALPS